MSSLLGEVHFEELPISDRVRCIETGHEMPIAEKHSYGSSKKCRRALFELCLAQKKPPLNVFEQSPTSRDKVICKITGDLLNKSEEAIWKHMNGKKFQRRLAQKEAEKRASAQLKEDIAMSVGVEADARQEEGGSELSNGCGNADESMDSEEPEFWAPPKGEMDPQCCEDEPSTDHGMCEGSDNDAETDHVDLPLKVKRSPSKLSGKLLVRSKKRKI